LGSGVDYATRQQRAPSASAVHVNFFPVLLACHWVALLNALDFMPGTKNESPTSICANGYFGLAPAFPVPFGAGMFFSISNMFNPFLTWALIVHPKKLKINNS
jgi:hypothetical protein